MSTYEQPIHRSNAQFELFTKCGEAYRRRYIEGDKIPPRVAMIKGSAFDGGVTGNYRQKIETHRDLPVSQIKELAVATFEKEVAGGYTLSEEEQSQGGGIVLGEAKDAAVAMAEFFGNVMARDYQPVAVQERVTIDLPSSPLMAVLDLATDKDEVVDFKTTGRRKSADEADRSVQLSVYDAAFRARYRRPAQRLALDIVVAGKKQISRQVLETRRDERDMQILANRVNSIEKSIKAGNFPPASPLAWWCSDKWCGYYRTCPYVNAQRKVAENGE
jgi:hypothetical protein